MTDALPVEAGSLPYRIVFPNRIRKLRETAGISQSQFTKLAGISLGHLSYIERGLRRPRENKLAQIAAALKVPVEELVVGPESTDEYRLWMDLISDMTSDQRPSLLFGARLREMRTDRGLTLPELAERCAPIKAWQVRQFEVSGRMPSPNEMQILAGAFGFASVEDLHAALTATAVDLSAELASAEAQISISRGVVRALQSEGSDASDPMLEAIRYRRPPKSRSIDGDRLASHNPLLKGSVVRFVRPTTFRDGMLCLVMNGNDPIGLGPLRDGSVLGLDGSPVSGEIWRIESINYLDRVF